MKLQTTEWVAKAEGDFDTASREADVTIHPNYDAIGFHAQQCIEKYLKARLVEAGRPFPKTHDLVLLVDLLLTVEPDWQAWRDDLASLTSFAALLRYPGDNADQAMADEAMSTLCNLRKTIRISLGLTD